MRTANLADIRKSVNFFNTGEVINIVNGRKKEDVGYFVPKNLKQDFMEFFKKLEEKQRILQAKKAAKAQSLDPIGDYCVGDEIK
jgi:hypothetical protein